MDTTKKYIRQLSLCSGYGGLGFDSEEFSQMREVLVEIEASLWRTWLRRWKRVKFIQHLCSRTLKSSPQSFVDGHHVRRVPLPTFLRSRKKKGTEDPRHLLPTYSKASNRADQQLCFSKMLRESSAVKQPMENLFSSMSSKV